MIPVPENAIQVAGIVVFVEEKSGKKYICIRKTYTTDEGETAMGKGMNISEDTYRKLIKAVGDLGIDV